MNYGEFPGYSLDSLPAIVHPCIRRRLHCQPASKGFSPAGMGSRAAGAPRRRSLRFHRGEAAS